MPKLYLLTNDDPLDLLLKKLHHAFETGVIDLLQIRRKHVPIHQLPHDIEQILTLAQRFSITTLLNDHMNLAHTFGIGVHLGQGDGEITNARALLGDNAIIGRTCHTSLNFAKQAHAEGANYVAFGAVFASHTKPTASRLLFCQNDLQTLQSLQQHIPLCLIGGITADNLCQLPQKLPAITPTFIATSHDILGNEPSHIAKRCQAWRNALIALQSH